jgi:hypothetical protein
MLRPRGSVGLAAVTRSSRTMLGSWSERRKTPGTLAYVYIGPGLKASPLNPLAARVAWVDHNPLNISV